MIVYGFYEAYDTTKIYRDKQILSFSGPMFGYYD